MASIGRARAHSGTWDDPIDLTSDSDDNGDGSSHMSVESSQPKAPKTSIPSTIIENSNVEHVRCDILMQATESLQIPRPKGITATSRKCSQTGCKQNFDTEELLDEHLQAEHGIKKYRCLLRKCDESFDAE